MEQKKVAFSMLREWAISCVELAVYVVLVIGSRL